MHGIVVLVVIVAIRIVLSMQSNAPRTPMRTRVVSLWIRVLVIALALVLIVSRVNPIWALGCWFIAFPLFVVNFLLVPAGVPYVTYYFTRVLRPQSISEEPVGGAAFYELRARLYRGFRLGEQHATALARRLAPLFDELHDVRVRGSTVVARGILDALGGRWDSARELFAVVQEMRWSHAPRAARAYAQAWLLAEAAQRGAYHEVVRLAQRGPATRRRAFFGACARRFVGGGKRPSRANLVLLWLVAPARRRGFGLLRRALHARQRATIEPEGSGLGAVTRATVALLRLPRGSVTRGELFRLAQAWQCVFDGDELALRLEQRRDELGANFRVGTLSAALEDDVVLLLAELLRDSVAADEPQTDEPPLITVAKDALQSELLGELETLVGELPAEGSKRNYGYEQHWRTWAHVRSLAATFVDVLPERRGLVYESVGSKIWNHAMFLHNDEQAWLLAHDVFRWLHLAAPDGTEAKQTLLENADLGRGF